MGFSDIEYDFVLKIEATLTTVIHGPTDLEVLYLIPRVTISQVDFPRKSHVFTRLRLLRSNTHLKHLSSYICSKSQFSLVLPSYSLCLLLFSLFSRCCECGCILSHWYYEREGQLYCKKHYWGRYGEHCHGCKETIATGLIMVTQLIITENEKEICMNLIYTSN